MKKILLIILLVFNVVFCHAHQDFYVTKTYDNLTVRIKTGYQYEEINKLMILGELGQIMLEELDYNGKVLIDFNHHYTEICEPDYFISYNNGSFKYTWSDDLKSEPVLSSSGIVIRIVDNKLDYEKALKLLEYAIEKKAYIKKNQNEIIYERNYCQWKIQTINTSIIKAILQIPLSETIQNVLKTKIERPQKGFKYGISYYFEDGQYTIFSRDNNGNVIDLKTLDNIYYFKQLENYSAIIFDTKNSFYYASPYGQKISSRNVVRNTADLFKPFRIKEIGGNKISIYFSYYSYEEGIKRIERTLLYLTDEDKLLQDFDKVIYSSDYYTQDKVEIYLATTEENHYGKEINIETVELDSLLLGSYDLLDFDDSLFVFTITEEARVRLEKVNVEGRIFCIVVNGEKLLAGIFWGCHLSLGMTGFVSFDVNCGENNNYLFIIYCLSPQEYSGDDPRKRIRITKED